MNFQRGDRVVYGVHGVCRITDIEIRKVDHKTVEYYVLAPCGQTGSCYYVPVHNQAAVAKMRTLMSKETLDAKRIISTEVSQILEITPREAEEYLRVRLEK
jgi:CarD family transcriptional regulator